jgi:5-methylcytosine-specific restriction enzyme subunit McrC
VTVISLAETGGGVEVPLTSGQAQALSRSGIVAVQPGEAAGRWRVRGNGYVGAARVGDLEVRVAPKVRIDRLLFMVGYATSGRHWRDEDLLLGEAPDLVPALAEALWRQTERALRQGLLQGYRTVDESSPVLRGRLREVDQMHRHRGQPWPLEIRHDEFTVDIPENQILRTALVRMLRVPRVDSGARQRLRHLAARLSEASVLPAGRPVPAWFPSRLNTRYQPALRLAELVLRTTSIEFGTGGVAVNGLLLYMPQVFEDFVCTALREELEASYGGRVRTQLVRHLDLAGRVVLKPDLVWMRHGRVEAVVDAKYKAEQPAGYPNADLYQLLAYCTTLGLPRGHLVYAAGNGEPAVHTIRNAEVEIVCHALDLAAAPGDLLSRISELGAQVVAEHRASRHQPPRYQGAGSHRPARASRRSRMT